MNIYVRVTDDGGRRLEGYQIVDECELYLNPLCIGSGQGRCSLTRIRRLRFTL